MDPYVCRICLQSAERVRLSRRDLSAFYAVCAISREEYQGESSVWVCVYCWTRASQCLRFVELARRTEALLKTNVSSDITSEEFHPYTVTHLQDTIVCQATECLIATGTYPIPANFNNIIPIKLENYNVEVCCEIIPNPVEVEWNNTQEVMKYQAAGIVVKQEVKEHENEETSSIVKEENSVNTPEEHRVIVPIKEGVREHKNSTNLKFWVKIPPKNPISEEDEAKALGFELVKATIEEQKKEIEKRKKYGKYRDSKYKCDCGTFHKSEEGYNQHLKLRHEAEASYECGICTWRFKTQYYLNSHVTSAHERRWRCLRCWNLVNKSNWKTHSSDCSTGVKTEYVCDICYKKHGTEERLKIHRHYMHIALKKYTCDYCKKTFRSKNQLIIHMRFHTGEMPHECVPCGKRFRTPTIHAYHMKKIHGDPALLPTEEPVFCAECNRFFNTKRGYDNHIATHRNHVGDEAFKYACDSCPKRFLNASYLEVHIKRVHLKIRDFPCAQCDKAYADREALADHVRRVHSERARLRNQVCDVCGAAFAQRALLQMHITAVHEKKRPYECNICGANFGFKAALFTHNKLKHKGEKRIRKSTKKASTSTV